MLRRTPRKLFQRLVWLAALPLVVLSLPIPLSGYTSYSESDSSFLVPFWEWQISDRVGVMTVTHPTYPAKIASLWLLRERYTGPLLRTTATRLPLPANRNARADNTN